MSKASLAIRSKSEDSSLFGMCIDAQTLVDSTSVATTETRTQLVQQVFNQSKGLGGMSSDPIDGSGLIHAIWGIEYCLVVSPPVGFASVPQNGLDMQYAAWISRDRESGVGIARMNQDDEQDFSRVVHSTSLNWQARVDAGSTRVGVWYSTDKNFWFDNPMIAIEPYYLDCRLDGIAGATVVVGSVLTAYVYYQTKRVSGKQYQYLMEKYTSGFGGMKSRARELS